MECKKIRNRERILSIILILFLMEVLTLPLVVYYTYADRGDEISHNLIYEDNRLHWDESTDIESDGTASLNLFSKKYSNGVSENGEKIVLPGTELSSIIRFSNREKETLKFTAVLYRKDKGENIPVNLSMSGENLETTDEYTLPDKIRKEDVVTAVKGTVKQSEIQDFNIVWSWDYYENDYEDSIDTGLANKQSFNELPEIQAGFCVICESDGSNEIIKPEGPETGDHSILSGYIVLMIISAVILVILLIEERQNNE